MPSSPEQAVNNLMQKDPTIIAVTVIEGNDNIVYQTDNWDITPDLDRVLSSWRGQNAQFIKISGVKYSMLQCTSERMAATSIKGEGSIVAAKDEEHKLIAYVSPEGDMRGAMMDTARAVGDMNSSKPYMDESSQLGKDMGGAAQPQAGGASNIDPQLKAEIESFLQWVKDDEGLAGYIRYYLQQDNAQIISQLSQVYTDLRQLFGV
ncbi:MAG: hypothetical protein GF311_15825 [Candidatus Lokiarchaeota archaeon]|jgi:hypothetical protein|nr:hypothetical protein [Candidatus Lokiarchaeota archaeon]